MLEESENCNKIFNEHFKKEMIKLTEKQEEEFKNAKYCHICNKNILKIIILKLGTMTILQVIIWVVLIQNVIKVLDIIKD